MPSSNYDRIACEYYDSRHVTSRNFDTTTAYVLENKPFPLPTGMILELGAGRGRAGEFLNANPLHVVQLDNSEVMFNLNNRENCALKVLADACDIPLVSQQFSSVVGFLVDPFMGLNFLTESYRMLSKGGHILLTVPTYQWGVALRTKLGIDLMTTRFKVVDSEDVIILPSVLHTNEQIYEMLDLVGFRDIDISDHVLPEGTNPISIDITTSCNEIGLKYSELPIITMIRARR